MRHCMWQLNGESVHCTASEDCGANEDCTASEDCGANEDCTAREDCGARNLRCEWLVTRPQQGLSVRLDPLHFDHLATVDFDSWHQAPPDRPDVYCRNHDLVATYQQPGGDQLRCQLMWSWFRHDFGVGWDLVLSTQTDRWNSRPAATLASRLPGRDGWMVDLTEERDDWQPIADQRAEAQPGAGVIVMPTSAGCAYVEMLHPQDALAARAMCAWTDRGWQSQVRLFDEPLEKGVIRRVRWRCVWVDQEDLRTAVTAAYHDFRQSPLPLTT